MPIPNGILCKIGADFTIIAIILLILRSFQRKGNGTPKRKSLKTGQKPIECRKKVTNKGNIYGKF